MKIYKEKNIKRFIFLNIITFLFIFFVIPDHVSGATSLQTLRASSNNLGLVGLWSLDGADVTDKVYDRSGQIMNGTFIGGATSSAKTIGKIGQAINFDGVDDTVRIPHNTIYTTGLSGGMTIAAWIKLDSWGGTSVGRIIDKSENTSGLNGFLFNVRDADDNLGFNINANATVAESAVNSIGLNRWIHVLVTATSVGTTTFYINGVQSGSPTLVNPPSTITTTNDLYIGSRNNTDRFFDGIIDDVRIYNRVLSSSEIKKIYNNGNSSQKTVNSITSGLVSHFTLDGADVTDKVYDKAGYTSSSTFIGGATSSAKTIGKIGQAMVFDGVDDYIDLNNGYIPTMSGENNTIMAWIKTATSSGGQRIAVQLNYSDARFGGRIETNPTIRGSYRATTINSNITPEVNRWYHVAVTKASTSGELYVDGQLVGTTSSFEWPTTLSGSNKDGSIGANTLSSPSNFWNGAIDDVKIYNRKVSADEILKIYSQGSNTVNSSRNTKQSTGLVALWSFDGPDVTDKIYDRSTNSNHGTFVGGATSSAKTIGKIGQAMRFDGSDDYINVLDDISLDNTSTLSISTWIRPTTLDGQPRGIVSKRVDSTSAYAYSLFVHTGDRLYVDIANSTDRFSTNTVLAVNNWYHVVVVYDGNLASGQRSKVYVNGVLDVTASDSDSTIGNMASTLTIGRLNGGTASFAGLIDDVRIYNRALTENEVKKLYNMGI